MTSRGSSKQQSANYDRSGTLSCSSPRLRPILWAEVGLWPDSVVAVIRPPWQLSEAKLPSRLSRAPAAQLTPRLDQRTIGSDHRQVHSGDHLM